MVYRIDQPTHRTEYQKETGAARFYYLRPIGFGSAMLGRVYKEIHIPAIARCVFVYATDENVLRMQKEYTILNPQAIAALYQDQ